MANPVFTPTDDDLGKVGSLVSVELFSAITSNLNYLLDSNPVGSKVFILHGLPGVSEPDPTMWQLCEGGIVTDQSSKLHDQQLPDDRGLYPKAASTIGQEGHIAGSHTRDFTHNHGGISQPNTIHDGNNDDNSDTDDDYITVYPHPHPIPADSVGGVRNVEPSHFLMKCYIKIR